MESSSQIEAKMSGRAEIGIKIEYSLIDSYPSLCLDKKDILLSEIEACEKLLIVTNGPKDINAIKKEIAELKMALDFLS
jgi:hypothetical protein